MKITFLVTTIDSAAGTERAIITQANSLVASGNDVEIHSVYRTTGTPAFALSKKVAVHYWVDNDPATESTGNLAGKNATGYRNMPSRLIPVSWDDQFSLMTDVTAGQILPTIDSAVIVTTTPALSLLAGSLANPRIVVVAQEHRASMRRGRGFEPLRRAAEHIDCIVSLTDASNEWLAKQLGGTGVRLQTIPNALPEVFRPQSTTVEKMVIAAGRLVPGKQFGQLIDAFSRASVTHPDWILRIYGDGPLKESLKNQAVRLKYRECRADRATGQEPRTGVAQGKHSCADFPYGRPSIGHYGSRRRGGPHDLLRLPNRSGGANRGWCFRHPGAAEQCCFNGDGTRKAHGQ